MICNCAEEIDSNCFRLASFIRKLLNLNGNSEGATVKRRKKEKKPPPQASAECN